MREKENREKTVEKDELVFFDVKFSQGDMLLTNRKCLSPNVLFFQSFFGHKESDLIREVYREAAEEMILKLKQEGVIDE